MLMMMVVTVIMWLMIVTLMMVMVVLIMVFMRMVFLLLRLRHVWRDYNRRIVCIKWGIVRCGTSG